VCAGHWRWRGRVEHWGHGVWPPASVARAGGGVNDEHEQRQEWARGRLKELRMGPRPLEGATHMHITVKEAASLHPPLPPSPQTSAPPPKRARTARSASRPRSPGGGGGELRGAGGVGLRHGVVMWRRAPLPVLGHLGVVAGSSGGLGHLGVVRARARGVGGGLWGRGAYRGEVESARLH